MIDIRELYRAPNSTREFIELEYLAEDFEQLELTKPVIAKITLMRIDEGIMFIVDELISATMMDCVRCEKEIEIPLQTSEGEWLFYDKAPREIDDKNEFLTINKEEMEVDPMEPIRQELLLSVVAAPHCPVECKSFEGSDGGVKALSGLKDLLSE